MQQKAVRRLVLLLALLQLQAVTGERGLQPRDVGIGEDSGQCASREELEEVRSELDSSREEVDVLTGEVDVLRRELRGWQNSTITILKKYLIEDTGIQQCECATEIKQLWEKLDRVQNDVVISSNQSIEASQQCTNTVTELQSHLEDRLDEITSTISDDLPSSFPSGNFQNPAPSCKHIEEGSPSGKYWIQSTTTGYATYEYCDMTRHCCASTGGWMRVAYLDMTDHTHHCPPGFRLITSPKRTCGRVSGPGCVSTSFRAHGVEYTKVCGRVIGYQDSSMDAFNPYYSDRAHTIDDLYVDGVSLTHGRSPRKHIWTFANALDEVHSNNYVCPCTKTDTPYTGAVPPFIGSDYFCETGSRYAYQDVFYPHDPLWNGEGCGSTSTCCQFNNPPWFCKELSEPTTDDIELRLCSDQNTGNEDAPLELVELYVQ